LRKEFVVMQVTASDGAPDVVKTNIKSLGPSQYIFHA
jgi:hypothetical protein